MSRSAHRPDILHPGMVQTGNQAGAKDLAQETSLKVFPRVGYFPHGDGRQWRSDHIDAVNVPDMQKRIWPTMTCGGTTYHVQSVGRPNIVMTERNGGWICLTAKFPADRLMD